MGVYKWKWNGSETTNTTKRVLYFDNVRAGNGKATLAEMTAGAATAAMSTGPTASTTSPTVQVVTEQQLQFPEQALPL